MILSDDVLNFGRCVHYEQIWPQVSNSAFQYFSIVTLLLRIELNSTFCIRKIAPFVLCGFFSSTVCFADFLPKRHLGMIKEDCDPNNCKAIYSIHWCKWSNLILRNSRRLRRKSVESRGSTKCKSFNCWICVQTLNCDIFILAKRAKANHGQREEKPPGEGRMRRSQQKRLVRSKKIGRARNGTGKNRTDQPD